MRGLTKLQAGTAHNQKEPRPWREEKEMSEGADWNTVSKHRKENVGQMANGGGRDLRRDKAAGALGQRRSAKQDTRTPRSQSSVSSLHLGLELLCCHLHYCW